MQARAIQPLRSWRGARALPLVLSLLLALAPLLSLAETLPSQAGAGDNMPCHETMTAATELAATPEACPHCPEGAPASQCHCCGGAGSPGVATFCVISHSPSETAEMHLIAWADALRCAPVDRRFRPPIQTS